jgi:hypothetical protein
MAVGENNPTFFVIGKKKESSLSIINSKKLRSPKLETLGGHRLAHFCKGKFQTQKLILPGCLKDVKHHHKQLLFNEFYKF